MNLDGSTLRLPSRFAPLAAVCALLLSTASGCGSSGASGGSGGAGGEGVGGSSSSMAGTGGAAEGSSTTGTGGALPAIDLSAALEQVAAGDDGYGGVVVRVHSPTSGDLWEGVSGDAWRGGPAMAPDDTFEVASITKTFTAVAVMQDVEQGMLSLDDALGDHLGPSWTTGLLVVGGHDYGPEITIRQLLSHTSGLPDYWSDPPFTGGADTNAFLADFEADPDHAWTPEEILSYVPDLTPIGAPGATWHYSDSNYVLLGVLLEELHGEPYDRVIRSGILEPMGLSDTYLTYHEAAVSGATESHRYEGHDDLHAVPRQSADWAGGGLVSSTADLLRFIEGLARGEPFSDPSTLAEMQAWVPTDTEGVDYGLGLFRVPLDNGLGQLWGHEGYGSSWMYYWPERGVTFVGTLNQTENDPWTLLEAALDQLAGP